MKQVPSRENSAAARKGNTLATKTSDIRAKKQSLDQTLLRNLDDSIQNIDIGDLS